MMFLFIPVVLLVVGGWHFYLWQRLIQQPAMPSPTAQILTIALIAFALLMPVAMILLRTTPRHIGLPVAWVAFVWMGFAFLLFSAVVASDLLRGLLWLAHRIGVEPLAGRWGDTAWRLAFDRWSAIAVVSYGTVATAFGMYTALRDLRVHDVEVAVPGLPTALDGFTIAQLTDIHVGEVVDSAFLARIVARVNGLKPDAIAITGDLVDGSVAQLANEVQPIAELRARHGVFFVTGNHEYYSGATAWMRHLRSLGLQVLDSSRVELDHDGARIAMAGVPDPTALRMREGEPPSVATALHGRDPAVPVVLLAHQPKAIEAGAPLGVTLQLSGHTHGGQLWPFGYLVALTQPYLVGLHWRGPSAIYVSPGTGFWGPPVRWLVPPEISRLVLRRRPAVP